MMGGWRRLALGLGFVGGAAGGGTLGWFLGLYAWRMGEVGLIEGTLFIASFLLMAFGLFAPLALVRYFTDRSVGLVGESGTTVGVLPLQVTMGRQVGSLIGYAAVLIFYPALAGVGIYLYDGGEGFTPFEMVAVFDAAGGFVLGGIAGVALISRACALLSNDR